MELRRFGSTALSISPLGLGSVNFGWLTNEADSFAILDRAFEFGINLIDTSDNYNAGKTEALLGRWFGTGGGRREKTVLATKVYSPPNDWGSDDPAQRTGSWVGPNERGLSAKHIREACEASLKRLGTDYIDVYQMHHIDRRARWEEVFQAMEVLIQQGKILYLGGSNLAGWHIAQAQEQAKARNFLGLISEQSLYNLGRRTVELEVLPAARAYGMAFLCYSPLGAGLLAGRPTDNAPGRRDTAPASERATAFQSLCDEIGHPPAAVALAWLLTRPGVTAPIVGPRTLEQFEGNLAALDIQLPPEALERLDKLYPGPGGPAPEAYAW